MEIQELRQVIEEPAALPDVRLTFEGNLVGDLLFETQGQAGTLPLLEFTLDQLFQRREGQTLTMAAYREMGGVKGALAKHAESTYASLPSDEHRSFAQMLFMRLVNLGTTEQDTTRRRAALSELSLPDAKQAALLREVADTFITARLLTTSEFAGVTTIEVSHEALIREWARLSNWLGTGREDIRLQQAVSQDVVEWEQRGRPRDRLYQGSQLKEAKGWSRRNVPSQQEIAFLQASTRRHTQSLLSVIIAILLLLSTTSLASWFMLHQPADPTRVTTSNDDGVGSLRWAIVTAKAGSTITFDTSLEKKVISLTSNDLSFTRNMIIRGPGAQSLAISGGKSGHIVRILPGITVAIFDLSFVNSNTGRTEVGFIKNEGTLTLTNSTISGNTSSNLGGGIINTSEGKLTLTNSTVSRNRSKYGGGIYVFVDHDHQTTIISCTIHNNTAHDGGGIFVDNGHSIDVQRSQITGNRAPAHPDIAGKVVLSQ
ncbi:MAG TPA: right-handed parallel beta-helix repeat-containing protein, partial [Ktedonobacteraceae bacterium]|nr:right-handed parallel beta-helix repeat-containing protein [Ktedonobacteraceae bacterium]